MPYTRGRSPARLARSPARTRAIRLPAASIDAADSVQPAVDSAAINGATTAVASSKPCMRKAAAPIAAPPTVYDDATSTAVEDHARTRVANKRAGGDASGEAAAPPSAAFSLVLRDLSASRATNTLRKLPLRQQPSPAPLKPLAGQARGGLADAPMVHAMLARQASYGDEAAPAPRVHADGGDDDSEWGLSV